MANIRKNVKENWDMGYQRWEKDEVEYLLKNYTTTSLNDMAKTLNRTRDSIFKKAKRLGLTNKVACWSLEDIELLSEKWGILTTDYIATLLNRTELSVKKKALELGLGPSRIGNGEYLTTGDIGYLLRKDPNLIYRWVRDGYIKGKRFGEKGIFRVKPKDFVVFLKSHPNKWNSIDARIDLIKGYLHDSFELPKWFLAKLEKDRAVWNYGDVDCVKTN